MNTKIKIVSVLILIVACVGFLLFLDFKEYKNIETQTIESKKNLTQAEQNIPKQEIVQEKQEQGLVQEIVEQQKTIIENSPTEERYYYFAYGSNMNIDTMRSRTKNTVSPISSAYINDYKLTFPRSLGSIEKENGYTVWGCLFLLDKDDISSLDTVEGYREGRESNSYNREKIIVTTPDNKNYEAYVYIQAIIGGDVTSELYKNTIIKGANDCSLPEDYIEKLKNLKTQ